MKRLFFAICLLAAIVSFSACGPGDDGDKDKEKEEEADKVKPEITFGDTNVLKLDLGDKNKALENVTALDDVDGDVTSSIVVSGDFDAIGRQQLKYTVSDKAGNTATKTRVVIIKADKLKGAYMSYPVSVSDTTQSFTNHTMIVEVEYDTVLRLNMFHNRPGVRKARFAGAYSFNLNQENNIDIEGRLSTLTGTISYGTSAENYKIQTMDYRFAFPEFPGVEDQEWHATCTPQ